MSTSIGWTEETWNPTTGCNKISQGCKNCYAERMSYRLQAMGQEKYAKGFEFTMHESELNYPLTLKKPSMIFVNSMSDLFHEKVSIDFLYGVFHTMEQCPQHIFQILTKRLDKLLEWQGIDQWHAVSYWKDNIWMGVSVEDANNVHRIHHLQETAAKVKWISCEPLLGPIPNLPLNGIHWVVVGGESGFGARPCKMEWIEDIVKQCQAAGVAIFVKQAGWGLMKQWGKRGKGEDFKDWPEDTQHLHIRQYPTTINSKL